MTSSRTRRRPSEVQSIVVRVPRSLYAIVKRLAIAEFTTPSGYIERRLSEVALMVQHQQEHEMAVDSAERDDTVHRGSEGTLRDGYL